MKKRAKQPLNRLIMAKLSGNENKKKPPEGGFFVGGVQWFVTYQVTQPAMTTKTVQMMTIVMMLVS